MTNKSTMVDYYYDLGSNNNNDKNNTIGAKLKKFVALLLSM